jgi:signal transduction histidine kinase
MAGSLEESRDELEAQNLELEAQTAELEDSQSELSGANDELRAQRAELEQAADQLAAEKEAVETSERFARLLAAETELDRLVAIALERFADVARAELATLYGATGPATGEPELRLLATRGVEAADLPQALAPGCGLAGRALAEKRPIIAHHGQTGLTLAAFGEQVAVRHELHLPLRHADRTIAVLTLARVHDSPFVDREIDALHHLGAQMAIALANAAALRAEQRTAAINRAVVDAVRDAIVLVAPDGGIVVANQAARDLAVSGFGLDLTDAPAGVQPQLAEKMTDPEAFARASEEIAGNPPHETFDEFELVEQGRVFERFTAQVRSDSELLGRISVVREVSRERQAERLKNDLMSTVSHELRTPLGSVLGFAELMLIRDVDAPTRQRYLQTIHSEAERLNALIDDFLDLRRIEEGHFELRPEPIDLAELLRERIDLVVVRSPGHGADLRLAADTHLPVVADRARIAQVIDNLLSNAVKYSPDGGDITIEAHQAVGMVRVCVIDRGLGIPADQQSQLFDKFFRVDREASRHIGGTGLGLTLCREIVEAHGGSIDFESHEGAGSRFCFEIPRSGPATTNPE